METVFLKSSEFTKVNGAKATKNLWQMKISFYHHQVQSLQKMNFSDMIENRHMCVY